VVDAGDVPDTPDGSEDSWHRTFAVGAFNATWDLIDRSDRTADDDVTMLLTAMASRWHWGASGGEMQRRNGDWQVAHVASLIGLGDLALLFAQRTLTSAEAEGLDGWALASAHEGMARAHAALNNAEGRAHHITAAKAALDREPDAEDRDLIASQLATVPEVST
jgi:hypothetical protein